MEFTEKQKAALEEFDKALKSFSKDELILIVERVLKEYLSRP